MFVSPSKLIWWNLIPKVQVFGDGAFGIWLGYEGKALMNGCFHFREYIQIESLSYWKLSLPLCLCPDELLKIVSVLLQDGKLGGPNTHPSHKNNKNSELHANKNTSRRAPEYKKEVQ